MSSDPRTEAGRIMFEYLAEHNLFVHDRIDDQLAEQFRAIEDESWNAALAAVEGAIGRLTGLDVTLGRPGKWMPDFGHYEKFTVPPATVTVVNGSGPLVIREDTVAAIASLRKPSDGRPA